MMRRTAYPTPDHYAVRHLSGPYAPGAAGRHVRRSDIRLGRIVATVAWIVAVASIAALWAQCLIRLNII